jgi:hypothetical protein
MATFGLSPGIEIREIDASQYTSTIGTGNVAAIVGYAEKGPFEPRLISGIDEFTRIFGKTIADIPYLAQTAYKFFAQGSTALVVRAGDDKDPDIYPQSAQYATKSIRLSERDIEATKGSITFARKNAVGKGTFVPKAEFGFKIIADTRGFTKPKIVDTYDVLLNEIANDWGTPTHPVGDMGEPTLKFAFNKTGEKNFETNFKFGDLNAEVTRSYGGTGTKSGDKIGSNISTSVYNYSWANKPAEDHSDQSADDYIQFTGVYGAAVLGTADLKQGYDWTEAKKEELNIQLGVSTYIITLNPEDITNTPSEVVVELNKALENAVDKDSGTVVDLSGDFEAFYMIPRINQDSFIGIRRLEGGIAKAGTASFKIANSKLATTLGFTAKEYFDNNSIYGTYNANQGGKKYSGNTLLTKKSNATNVESFADPVEIAIEAPDSGSWELSDIVGKINVKLAAGSDYPLDPVPANASLDNVSGKIKIETVRPSDDGFKAIVRIKGGSANSLIELLELDLPADGSETKPIGESLITLRAAEKGSYGNRLALKVETKQMQTGLTTVEDYYNVYVISDGKEVSNYQRVNWTDPLSDKFISTVLAQDLYLNIDIEDEDSDLVYEKLPDGIWILGNDDLPDGVLSTQATITEFSRGTNGWESDDNGVITSLDADYINALKKIYNPEVYDFNLVVAPGGTASAVQNEIQNLCESRHDCFGVLDAAPFGLGLGVKEHLNHVSEINAMNENINSSYVGTYWPWLQDYDADNKQYIWLPPSIYALTQLVYTDNVADPWYAAAGLSRGKVTALDVEYSATADERDILYGDTNVINPIVKFVGEGIAIWGQKTGQRTKSALDRINVRRLMIYAEKLIAKMARGFLFEQHDAANWAAFARQANAILEPIRQRRGINQYQVICDSSTNTPALIDQNIMAGKIFLQPTKVIEYITCSFTISSQGSVEFTE